MWYDRFPWTRVMITGYLLGCIGVGILGLTDAPTGVFGQDSTQDLYSWIMVLFGLIGLGAIPSHPHIVVRAIWAIAFATLIHGILAWYSGQVQTGLRLIIAPLMMFPAIWAWGQWLTVVKKVRKRKETDDAGI